VGWQIATIRKRMSSSKVSSRVRVYKEMSEGEGSIDLANMVDRVERCPRVEVD
jgi:hypothetical protein